MNDNDFPVIAPGKAASRFQDRRGQAACVYRFSLQRPEAFIDALGKLTR